MSEEANVARHRRSRSSTRGYTAIEVMLAMTVLFISSAGVMSMQKAAIQGNLDARKLDVASSVSRTWLDRLSTDAASWNSSVQMTHTAVLSALYTGSTPNTGFSATFQAIPTAAYSSLGWSGAFDLLGRDVPAGDPSAVFCAQVSIDQVAFDPLSTTSNQIPTLIRANVMVYWSTQLSQGGAPASPFCTTAVDASAVNAANGTALTYHTLFASESLRRAP